MEICVKLGNTLICVICLSCNEARPCSRTVRQAAKGICNDCYAEGAVGNIGPWISGESWREGAEDQA